MRLSGHDASFLYAETASSAMHSIAFIELEDAPSFEELYNYYAARIHLIPRLRQKLAFVPFGVAHPKWVDDPAFDLSNHIKSHRVPEGTSLTDAIDIAMSLGEPLLDRTRPLWLFYILENVEGRTLVAQMTHHAFVDGATLVAISTVLTDASPNADQPEPSPPWEPEPVPSDFALWQEGVAEQAATAVSSLQRPPPTPAMTRKVGDLLARLTLPVMQAPWNAGLVGPKRQLTCLQYQLEDFRGIRHSLGGTVNDVALACVVEAAARYMAFMGENTSRHQLRIMCPVNIRGEEDDPLNMGGNKVSGLFPVLSATQSSMQERYEEVLSEMQGIKEREEAETIHYLQESQPPVPLPAIPGVGTSLDPSLLAARIPTFIIPNYGFRPQQSGNNFTFTNVFGPPYIQYVAGHKVTKMYGSLMLGGNLGLGISLNSYGEQFTFSFTADPRLVKRLDKFRDLVAASFAELQQVAHEARD